MTRKIDSFHIGFPSLHLSNSCVACSNVVCSTFITLERLYCLYVIYIGVEFRVLVLYSINNCLRGFGIRLEDWRQSLGLWSGYDGGWCLQIILMYPAGDRHKATGETGAWYRVQ